jgi:hypothetical protein
LDHLLITDQQTRCGELPEAVDGSSPGILASLPPRRRVLLDCLELIAGFEKPGRLVRDRFRASGKSGINQIRPFAERVAGVECATEPGGHNRCND